MSALLERERELAELDAAIAAAGCSVGSLVVVEAPAGLGKTRLLQSARERARAAGMRVLAARATELERDFPFALVRQLFEPALAPLDASTRESLLEGAAGAARGALGIARDEPPTEPAGGGGDTFAVLHGLYWLAAGLAEQRPLLLAVDDAHWADAASLDALGFLVPRLEELPLLLVLACRLDEAGAKSSLARIATDALARRLTPGALSATGASALLAEQLGQTPEPAFAATCHEVSGGNPFLLCELARTLAAEEIAPAAAQAPRVHELAPERVSRTVQVRLARLSPAAQALARALVVLGDGAADRLVAELAELDEAVVARAADELRTASILGPEASLRFIHPLVRTALAAELAAGERVAAHARAVELLRTHGAGAQELATHLIATGARGERATAATLLEAARAALASGAPGSATAYLGRALREPPPDDLRPGVLSSLITAGIRAPDRALFDAVLPEVLAELRRTPALHVRWAGKLAIWMILNGRAEDAQPLLERAIEIAGELGDPEAAFRLEAQLNLLAQRSLPAARARLLPYLGGIEPDSAGGRLAAALETEWHAFDGTATDAIAAARRALAHEGAIFREQPEFFAPGRPVLALIHADQLDEAQRAAEQALTYARQRGATPELIAALWMTGGIAWSRGDLAAAEADARQALDIARLGRLWIADVVVRAVLAGLLVLRGELDAADAELDAGGLTGHVPQVFAFSIVLAARGQLRLQQGRLDEAVADLVELDRLSKGWGVIGAPFPPARIGAARALAAAGDRERARAKADAALAQAQRWGAPTFLSHALRAVAMTADGAEQLATLEDAAAVLEGSPTRLARAEALADLGAALRRGGRRTDARAPLREALELARRCGAAGLARRAYDELAATGERVRRYTPIGVESLTPSERRVAELAASGMTNRQIAQTLFVTVKTVEAHLAAAYDKLGIRSRQQLPTALADRSGRAPSTMGRAGVEPARP
jgi:DNA-binding NarL/FixJ family response regulator